MKKIQNIHEHVLNSLKKHNVVYETTNGKPYKISKIVYYISAAVTAFMVISYILGQLIYYDGALNNSDKLLRNFMPTAILFGITTLILIVGVIFSAKKKDIIGGILTFCPVIVQLIAFIPEMRNVHLSRAGLNQNYWWRHFLPSIICIAAISLCVYIVLKAKYIEDRAYKNMVENIYAQKKDVAELSEEEWNEFLANYDPRKVEEERRRAKKNKGYTSVFEENDSQSDN